MCVLTPPTPYFGQLYYYYPCWIQSTKDYWPLNWIFMTNYRYSVLTPVFLVHLLEIWVETTLALYYDFVPIFVVIIRNNRRTPESWLNVDWNPRSSFSLPSRWFILFETPRNCHRWLVHFRMDTCRSKFLIKTQYNPLFAHNHTQYEW